MNAPFRPTGGLARRSAALCALLAALGPVAGAAAASPPGLVLSPTNGTPGSTVAIRGIGFCGTAGCSPVRVLFAGTPVADGLRVGRDGAFRGEFRVPGGGVVGVQNVTAVQTLADGNERQAHAGFDLVFGKGEAAERQAHVNDLQGKRPEALASEGPARGVPLASFAAGTRAQGTTGSPAPGRIQSSPRNARVPGGGNRPPWYLMIGGIAAAIGGGALVGKLIQRSRDDGESGARAAR